MYLLVQMSQEKNKNIATRLSSMILDHFIMTFVITIVTLFFALIGYLIVGNPLESELPFKLIIIPIILVCLIFSVYYNKDAIKGQSPAKRILGLIVLNNTTGQIASPIQCVVRNITLVLCPIEVIVATISPERRIGDYIAGTRVAIDNKSLDTTIKKGQIIISLIIGGFIFLLAAIIQLSIQGFSMLGWN